jgi:hypothetical protein
MKRFDRWIVVSALIVLAAGAAAGAGFESPDSDVNPKNQDIETADPVWTGTNHDIQYVIKRSADSRFDVYEVSVHPLDDLRPRVAIAPNGDAWVAWWRDGAVDGVVVRKRNFAEGSWDAERVLSLPDEGSRNPVVVHDGAQAWVAYEFDDDDGETGIGVAIVIDEPDPIGIREDVAKTPCDDPLDLNLHAEGGRLWITWIDGDGEVGWVALQSGSWSLPLYESYAADSVEDARARIRDAVLGE